MYKTIIGNLHNNSIVRLVWYLLDDQAELNFSFFPLSFRYQKKHLTWSDLYITKCFIGLWSETLFQLSWWTEKLSQELELGLGFSSTSSLHLIIILSSKTWFICNTLVVKYMSLENSCWMNKNICLTVRQPTKTILSRSREKKGLNKSKHMKITSTFWKNIQKQQISSFIITKLRFLKMHQGIGLNQPM